MISETKFHPSTELLQEFAAGTLSAGLNIAISAHVEFCELCCHKTSEFEAKAAIDWLQTSEKPSSMRPQSFHDSLLPTNTTRNSGDLPRTERSSN